MRYWIEGADEDYQRARLYNPPDNPPSPLSLWGTLGVALLVAGEVLLWIAMPLALLLHWH